MELEKALDLGHSLFFKRTDIEQEFWDIICKKHFKKKDHLYFSSSGTNSKELKVFEIEFETMLKHSKALNNHFNITSNSKWLLSLPDFYMGGISIMFRGLENKAKVFKSSAKNIIDTFNEVKKYNITHLSLVPSQINSLIHHGIKITSSVKMIFIGGDSLSINDFESLKSYPAVFFPTYGSSELCSQVATSLLERNSQFNTFKILPWNKLFLNDTNQIQSPYYYKSIYYIQDEVVIKEKNTKLIFNSEDRGIIEGEMLTVLGRIDRKIKSSGIFIDLDKLELTLAKMFPSHEFYITAISDKKRGLTPIAITKTLFPILDLQELKIFHQKEVLEFLYTPSGKLKKRLIT